MAAHPVATAKDLAPLLDYLYAVPGGNFRGYKPASIGRRARKRMAALDLDSYSAYRDYLVRYPEELPVLFDTLLINVTAYFRDPGAWDVIRTVVIPKIVAKIPDHEPLRIWSAGCATGEEAYTLAILLAEAIGIERFRRRATIYATDVDEEALATARHAAYSLRQVQGIPAELIDKYFDWVSGLALLRKDLRQRVIFGRHNLMHDTPISRIALLACRNTLMYFDAETQAAVLQRLHFALGGESFLFLGRAETLLTYSRAFTPINLEHRVWRKVAPVSRQAFCA